MKLKYITFIFLITTLLMSVNFQAVSANVGDLKSNKYIFNYSDSAKYTNALDTSIKFSGNNKFKTTYSFSDKNGTINNDYWIFGIVQQEIDAVNVYGTLYDGEFQLYSIPAKQSSSQYVNMTLKNPDSYNSTFGVSQIPILPFTSGFPVVTTVANNKINTPFIAPNYKTFVVDPTKYIEAVGGYYKDQVAKINNDNPNLKASYTASGLKFSYTVTGSMLDYHKLTHFTNIQSDSDYNTIKLDAKINLEYDKSGALKTYNEQWTITNLDGVNIMVYNVAITTGFFANAKYNLPGFEFYLTILGLLALPILLKIKRRSV